MRLTTTYLPNLVLIPSEFQRELTTRFIEGLDDDKLKKKLRRHCKRDKNNLEEAFNFALDYETAEVQTCMKEEATVLASGVKRSSSIAKTSSSIGQSPTSNNAAVLAANAHVENGDGGVLRREMKNMAAKQKSTEMRNI